MPLRKPRRSHPFADEARGVAREPIVEHEQRGEGRLERRVRVPEDLAFLDGHFTGFPVVPGTVQLGWAIGAAQDLLGRPVAVRCVEALKFPTLLRPGNYAVLRVELSPDGAQLHFGLEAPDDAARVFASGRCSIGDAP